jgi:hypothetical protein
MKYLRSVDYSKVSGLNRDTRKKLDAGIAEVQRLLEGRDDLSNPRIGISEGIAYMIVTADPSAGDDSFPDHIGENNIPVGYRKSDYEIIFKGRLDGPRRRLGASYSS